MGHPRLGHPSCKVLPLILDLPLSESAVLNCDVMSRILVVTMSFLGEDSFIFLVE